MPAEEFPRIGKTISNYQILEKLGAESKGIKIRKVTTMKFERPIEDLIRARRSVRTYTGGPLDVAVLELLSQSCASLTKAPFGERARFKLVEKPFGKNQPAKLGDYGLQKNPRYFMVGAIDKGLKALEGYGYLMEHLVLRATELGVGTCWLGYFNRAFFADFESGLDELVPAVVVAGVPLEKPWLGDRIGRRWVKADSRENWPKLFFKGDLATPLVKEEASPYDWPLEMLRLAPSSGNTQPWRIVKEPQAHRFHFYLRKMKQDYYDRGLHHIDIGIAMCHLELASREKGLRGEWKVSDPGIDQLPEGIEYVVTWAGK